MYTVPSQTGKRFIITGANSGTGKEATRRIAAAGGEVIMAVRTPAKGEEAKAEILRETPGAKLEVRQLDLADLDTVRAFAASILAEGIPVDVLVNNAGVMIPPTRMLTKDGFELQFGTNFLGPFALTMLLLPRILESPSPRVATMSSGVANAGRIDLDDLSRAKRYTPWSAYGQSKLADMLMGMQLAELSRTNNLTLLSTIAHPGFTRTNLQTAGRNLGKDDAHQAQPSNRTFIPSQSVEQGVEPLLFAATDPAAEQGAYYGPGGFAGLVGKTKKTRLPRSARKDPALPAALWNTAERLTDTRFEV